MKAHWRFLPPLPVDASTRINGAMAVKPNCAGTRDAWWGSTSLSASLGHHALVYGSCNYHFTSLAFGLEFGFLSESGRKMGLSDKFSGWFSKMGLGLGGRPTTAVMVGTPLQAEFKCFWNMLQALTCN